MLKTLANTITDLHIGDVLGTYSDKPSTSRPVEANPVEARLGCK